MTSVCRAEAPALGCDVPRGYDCATPGYEKPLTLAEAEALSAHEKNVVYLYGPGIQDARFAAEAMTSDTAGRSAPTIAVPGSDVPKDVFYLVVIGKVVKHNVSRQPVEFYQRYIDRGRVFSMTWAMYTGALQEDHPPSE